MAFREPPELSEQEIATLRALAEACNFSPHAHPPEEAVLRRFQSHLRGDARRWLRHLHTLGLCVRHKAGGNMTYNITQEGIRLARIL